MELSCPVFYFREMEAMQASEDGAVHQSDVEQAITAHVDEELNVLVRAAEGGLFDTANSQNGQSDLGTYDHWQSEYARDLERFSNPREDHDESEQEEESIDGSEDSDGGAGDSGKRAMGQIWYGRNVAAKQAALVAPYCTAGKCVVDVGAGNGELLCRLASMRGDAPGGVRAEWAHFIGTDYCAEAVLLARAVAKSQRKASCDRIEFIADDIFHSALPPASVDVLLDKGTLDALSCLFDDARGTERIIAYGRALARLGKTGHTVLCVTSGNFSIEELNDVLSYAGWEYADHVKDYPTFQFMGVTGTHVRTVLYRLNKRPPQIPNAIVTSVETAVAITDDTTNT